MSPVVEPLYTLEWLPETGSTNSEALRRAHEGAPDWTVIAADRQTAGRGRLARAWHSPPGSGLYCTVIVRPRIAPAELSFITLAAGVAVCLAIESACDLKATIKWPNDILIDGRKVAGILTESDLTRGNTPTVLIGIGINVTHAESDFPPDVLARATSLFLASGSLFSRKEILAAIIPQLKKMITGLEEGRKAEVLACWRERDALLGKSLTWVTVGDKAISGQALGIDELGLYHIRDAAGMTHQVLSGDLSLSR